VQLTFAQEKTISGVVSDDQGLPLPAATVLVKGTSNGTSTDFDGNYQIKANAGDVLQFTYVGYTSKEVTVGNSNTISVTLITDTQLDEVVVVAYGGATEAKKVAAAVATVQGEKLAQIPINSLDQVLQGAAAGVSVNTGSGQPGQSATIIIRGRASLNGEIEPLYVIDGVPVDGDNFRSLNTNDIETFSVLKDAAGTAIYGNRGAGGVILITTKQGKRNQGLKVQYRTLYGVALAPKAQFDVMNAKQFLTYQRDLVPGTAAFGNDLNDAEISAIARQTNTDWSDIFFRQGTTQSHQLTFSSGAERSTSYTSLQYFEQEGITLGSELQRFSVRNNISGTTANDRLNYATNLTVNYSKSNFIVDAARGNNTGGQLDNPFIVPYIGLPYYSPYNPDGSINTTGTAQSGGFGGSEEQNGFLNTPFLALNTARFNTDQENEIKAVGSVKLDYNFADNLTFGTLFGLDYTNITSLAITNPNSLRGSITPNAASLVKGSQGEGFFRQSSFITNAYLRYENDITDKLNLNAAIYGEYNYNNTQSSGFTAFGLNPALLGSGSAFTPGSTTEGDDNDVYNYIPNVFSAETELALASVFATLDLDWDDKYGLSAVVRQDKTSRFPQNPKGVFYSIAGRWNIDQEPFLQNSDLVTSLKLRASYGVVGNQEVGSRYQGIQTVNSDPGYQLNTGYTLGGLVDDGIKWETTNQFNLGLGFGLWNNRLSGEVDYYRNYTEDLFAQKPLSLSGTGASTVTTNVADMSNTGVDLQINFDLLRKSNTNNWAISLNANGNYNKNVVESLPGEFAGTNALRITEGRQAFTWFLPRWAGVDPSNGQPLYLDADGNITNVFDPNNAVYLDKNFDPTYTGGFGADISYKNFTLNSLFSFQADRWRNNSSLAIIEDVSLAGFANQSTSMLNAWTTPGQVTDIPALSNGGLRAQSGDRYLEDASFLRLRNVTLAYNLDSKALARTKFITQARVYVQGTNLVTWTKWRGFDPEGNGSTGFFDYPVPRTVTLGFDLTF
jgi:TonB-linked SusC/RagA family outer membrane protein